VQKKLKRNVVLLTLMNTATGLWSEIKAPGTAALDVQKINLDTRKGQKRLALAVKLALSETLSIA
jgi:hypothetical protein